MSERPVRSLAVLVVGAGVLVAVVVLAIAFLGKDRRFHASVPQPTPLESTAVVPVPAGESACLDGITVWPTSEVAEFRIGTRGKPPVPIGVTLSGPGGYRSTAHIPATWKDNDLLSARLDPPSRTLAGRFCLRNEGRRPVDVYAADDRTQTLFATYVGAKRADANIDLAFFEAEPGTVANHAGSILDHMSVFRPGFIGPWLLWPLAVLVVLGVPCAFVWAMWRAVREDR
jgi:hypothetical protein